VNYLNIYPILILWMGDRITQRGTDVRPIIGAAVVFLIIGSIIFGVFYFFVAKPAAEALETSKLSAMSLVDELNSIGTLQAISAASTYSSQIQAAGSSVEVESIVVEVNAAIQREEKRKELLDRAISATTGSFYSATGTGGTQQVEALSALLQTLQDEINAKSTLSELQSYEASGTIDSQATTTWQNFFTSLISDIQNENILMIENNSPASWYFMTKSEALSHVAESTWQTLRKLDFEGTSYIEVPISDKLNRAPTITAGSQVNIYIYDKTAESLHLITGNATVSKVLYSRADLATIAWSMTAGTTSQSYAVNIWETLKAAAAGSAEAAAVGWQNYGSEVMSNALNAGVLDFNVNAIYVVKVPAQAGESIIQYEFYQSATKDVILAVQAT